MHHGWSPHDGMRAPSCGALMKEKKETSHAIMMDKNETSHVVMMV